MASKAAKAPAKSVKLAKGSAKVAKDTTKIMGKAQAKGAAHVKAKPAPSKPAAKVAAAKPAKPAVKASPAAKAKPVVKAKVEPAKPAKVLASKELPKKGAKAAEPAAKPAKVAAVMIEKPAPAAKEVKSPRGKKGIILSPEALSASAALRKVKGQADGVASAALAAHEAAGDQVCREVACEGLATTSGYCRLHYIKNWRKIKRKELILKEGKLNQYIEELVAKYPEKYIDAIKQDLASEKEFSKIIYDLDLDGSVDEFDIEGENDEDIIDDIKREIDDDSEPGF